MVGAYKQVLTSPARDDLKIARHISEARQRAEEYVPGEDREHDKSRQGRLNPAARFPGAPTGAHSLAARAEEYPYGSTYLRKKKKASG